jgi:C4-dicarboxylate-specific signal transduction histidine kinase
LKGKAVDRNKTARFEMSETLKTLLKILLLFASAGIPYYFRFVLSMEVALADLLYALIILLVLWWPTGGTVAALSLSVLLIMSHLFTEPSTPLRHDLQRSLTLFAVALLMSSLSRQAKDAEQEVRQRSQELSALNAIASTASQSLDLDEILKATLDKVLETIGGEAGAIYLLDQGNNNLVAKVYRGISPEFVEETMRWDRGLARRGLRSGEPIVVEDISKEPGLTRMAATREDLRSYIGVPLKSKDKVLGMMNVIARRPRRFAPRDVELLTSVGNQIGVAIENARLYEAAQREVTERKRMEEELRKAYHDLRGSQAKLIQSEKLAATGRLAASMAHEINNPLQGISNYLSAISRQVVEEDPLHEDLEMVKLGFERISEIVRRLRAFYRPADEAMAPTDINGVVKRVLALLGHQLSLGKVAVKTGLAEQDLPVLGSAGQLEQVLVNLVVNAQDAMPQGGELMVRTALHEDMVQLQVSDTGHGIGKEQMSRLFEPFSSGKEGEGLGLGLWISHNIIEGHGGHIEVESQVGQGTTFIVSLPAYL